MRQVRAFFLPATDSVTNVMKKIILLPLCFTLFCGCATGTHIITGIKHTPLKPEQVTLYQVPPPKFEIVGIVNAQSPGRYQRNMDDAVRELKIQAAKIGANGIVLSFASPGGESVGAGFGSGFGGHTAFSGSTIAISSSGIQLSGEAIYVAPE